MLLALGALGLYTLKDSVFPYEPKIHKKGEPLDPKISIEQTTGKKEHIADFRGKVLLINFWAGWCTPCLVEMPGIYKLYEKYKERGFEVLAVNIDENWQDGVKTLDRKIGRAPFPHYIGQDSEIFKSFSIIGVPYTVLVDRKGIIQYAEPGEWDWQSKEAIQKIESML